MRGGGRGDGCEGVRGVRGGGGEGDGCEGVRVEFGIGEGVQA